MFRALFILSLFSSVLASRRLDDVDNDGSLELDPVLVAQYQQEFERLSSLTNIGTSTTIPYTDPIPPPPETTPAHVGFWENLFAANPTPAAVDIQEIAPLDSAGAFNPDGPISNLYTSPATGSNSVPVGTDVANITGDALAATNLVAAEAAVDEAAVGEAATVVSTGLAGDGQSPESQAGVVEVPAGVVEVPADNGAVVAENLNVAGEDQMNQFQSVVPGNEAPAVDPSVEIGVWGAGDGPLSNPSENQESGESGHKLNEPKDEPSMAIASIGTLGLVAVGVTAFEIARGKFLTHRGMSPVSQEDQFEENHSQQSHSQSQYPIPPHPPLPELEEISPAEIMVGESDDEDHVV